MKEEKEREKLRDELRNLGDEFLGLVREWVDDCVLLCDVGRFERLVSAFRIHTDSEVLGTIREKGFSKELRELCDRVGEVEKRQ